MTFLTLYGPMQLFCDGNKVLVCYSLSEFCFRSLTFEARSSYKLRPRCSLMLKEFLQVVFCKIKKCYNFLSFLCCPPGLTVLFGTCTLPVVQFVTLEITNLEILNLFISLLFSVRSCWTQPIRRTMSVSSTSKGPTG